MTKLSNKQRREAEEAGQEEQQQKKKKAHERRVQEANPLQKAQQKDQALKHMAETLPLPAPNQRVYTRLFCIVRLYDNPQEAIKALHAAGKLEAFMTFSVVSLVVCF